MVGVIRRKWITMNIPLIKSFPEGDIKNFLRSLYFSFKLRNFARVRYGKRVFYYYLKRDKRVLKSHFSLATAIKVIEEGYLRYYSPKKGDVVLDAGAYPGDLALYLSSLVGSSGKIISLEPDLENYNKMVKNLELNKIKNVILLNKGLWKKDDLLTLSSKDYGSSFKEGGKDKVEVVSIDSLMEKQKLKKIDFIKMDIEGAEIEAIIGAKNTLDKYSPKIAIASYHIRDGEKTALKLERMFSSGKYNCVTSFPYHLTTYVQKGEIL